MPGGRKEYRQIVKLYEDGSLSIWQSRGFTIYYKSPTEPGTFTSAVLYRDARNGWLDYVDPDHWLLELDDIINNDPGLVMGAYTKWKL